MNKTPPQSIMPTGSEHILSVYVMHLFNSLELGIERRTLASQSSALTVIRVWMLCCSDSRLYYELRKSGMSMSEVLKSERNSLWRPIVINLRHTDACEGCVSFVSFNSFRSAGFPTFFYMTCACLFQNLYSEKTEISIFSFLKKSSLILLTAESVKAS